MKRARLLAGSVLVLALLAACATVGAGDARIVRAEDALSNSLSTYDALMRVHFANSRAESPAVYRAMEQVRENFPIAWRAVNNAKKAYQSGVKGGASVLDAALDALDELVQQAGALSAGR